MRNLCQWMFAVVLTAGCGTSTSVTNDQQDDPSGQQSEDATLLNEEAIQCVADGVTCQVGCLDAFPYSDVAQLFSGCENDVYGCMNDPTNVANVEDCISDAVDNCEAQAREKLDQIDMPVVQEEIAGCQTTCTQTANTCVADLADDISDDTLQCANSAVAGIDACVTALNQCDYEALADAVDCDETAIATVKSCLISALLDQDTAAAQACIENLMASCNFPDVSDQPCVTGLAVCPTDVQDTFDTCMP